MLVRARAARVLRLRGDGQEGVVLMVQVLLGGAARRRAACVCCMVVVVAAAALRGAGAGLAGWLVGWQSGGMVRVARGDQRMVRIARGDQRWVGVRVGAEVRVADEEGVAQGWGGAAARAVEAGVDAGHT